ncbi:hypothetical protein Glove_108g55 [Diversispora epigaea]|uniref:Uncharacterized protein n=1 Tax=Diversispora epigaea TaxID=1348612 RepID=A0A397J2S1_9GLOM|nr:hypothetical protein Glove_108g55 [Diversispora epigaea]
MDDSDYQLRIFRILPQFNNVFEGVNNLYDMGTIKTDKEAPLGSTLENFSGHKFTENLRLEKFPDEIKLRII